MIDTPMSRRSVLAGIGAATLPLPIAAAPKPATITLFAGGYNREGGRGVLPLAYTPADERWQADEPVAAAPDASYAVHSSRFGLHYLVQEGTEGTVNAFRVRDGQWQQLAHLSSGGADPCHLALDPRQSVLAAANYSSGSVTLFRLDPRTGLPIGPGTVHAHQGSGPDRERQTQPHAHWIGFTPDNRWLRAVDLGADTIFAYPFDAAQGRLGAAQVAYRAEPGSGPRHLAFHPSRPFAYLASELANTVTVLRLGNGATLHAVATLSTLPADFTGKSFAGAIVINTAGTRLYVSNRGHDSVAVFGIGADGTASLIQHVGCGGRWPRLIHLLEGRSRLLVANQRSGGIAAFRIGTDGRLAPHGSGTAAPGVAYIGEVA
ncbi:lactonase family protein [uncultured Sphingomonas sp.]|uniref:lactonase family protein n=1 Tax=uncultured Sphingomonas sp. TaxID=158754 RepID=UPI0025FE4569|nr:lactonase family protein [uncultured Sphingomonas sp.]